MPFPEFPITDPVFIFALTMLVVLIAPFIFERMRIPGIVGLVVFGAAIGPGGFGILERGTFFEILGLVGLLYLMFTAGLALDLNQFLKQKERSFVFGLISFFIPQVMALAIMMPLLDFTLAQALLVGSVVGSHTLLSYPIVRNLGIDKNRSMVMTMGGTMVTDMVSLLILAVVVAAYLGDIGFGFWTQFVGLVAVWAVAVIVGLPKLARWFYRNVRKGPEVEFVFTVAAVFTVAYLAGLVQLAPILGAFLAGIVLNPLVPERSALMIRIQFVGNALLIPIFLVSVGMLVNISALFMDPSVWILVIAFTLFVVLGKSIAAKTVQRIFGFSPAEGWAVAGLSIPQAAATLAVTLVAFEVGLFDELVVNAVVVLIMITCLVGPSLVARFGREVALQEEDRPYEPSEAPQRIMVPLANPETSEELMDVALLIHNPDSQQPIYPLAIARSMGNAEAGVAEAERLLSRAVVHASAAEVPVRATTRVDVNVANGIRRAIQEERISTVVIGWSGDPTARQYIFGSILDQLLDETHEMIFVCRILHPINTISRLVVAIPPYAEREAGFGDALRALKIMAQQTDAELVLVTPADSIGVLLPRVKKGSPDVTVEPKEIPNWGQLIPSIEGWLEPNDLIVLLSVREGSVAWRPTLDRLPRMIARRFSENSFITLYVADEPVRSLTLGGDGAGRRMQPLDVLTLERIRLNVESDTPAAILEEIMKGAFDDSGFSSREVAEMLLQIDPGYAPELMPGVALYHAHTPLVQRPFFLVGVSRKGARLPHTSRPTHVVLIVLVPREESTRVYLEWVSTVAKMIHTRELVKTLCAADAPEQVRSVLEGSLRTQEHV